MLPRDVFEMDRKARAEWGAARFTVAEILAGLAAMEAGGYDLIEGSSWLGWGFVPGGSEAGGLTPARALAELGRRRLEAQKGVSPVAEV